MRIRYPIQAAVLVLGTFGCAGASVAADDYSNGMRADLAAYDMSWHNFSKLPVDKSLRAKEMARQKAAMATPPEESADYARPSKRKTGPRTPG